MKNSLTRYKIVPMAEKTYSKHKYPQICFEAPAELKLEFDAAIAVLRPKLKKSDHLRIFVESFIKQAKDQHPIEFAAKLRNLTSPNSLSEPITPGSGAGKNTKTVNAKKEEKGRKEA